jgi:hypothetical protein
MNSKQRALFYGIAFMISLRLFFVTYDYIKTNGQTDNIYYQAENPSHSYRLYKQKFDWKEELIYDFSMLGLFSIMLTVVFMPNILSTLADKRNKKKSTYNDCSLIFQNKIEKLNQFHLTNNEENLNDSLSSHFKNQYISILNGWAQKNMKKKIEVEKYKPIDIIEIKENEATVISFQNRKEYLEFNGNPLKNQETETIWQHLMYVFQKIENDWKIVGFKSKPADNEILKFIFK